MAALLASSRCIQPVFSFRNIFARRQVQQQLKKIAYSTTASHGRPKSQLQLSSEQYATSQGLHFRQRASGFHTTAYVRDQTVTVTTPGFADSVTEGDITWEKAVGDYVEEDEVLASIETDKTTMEVKAPSAGTIQELLVPDGVVAAGQQLAILNVSGEKPAKTEAAAPAAQPEPAAPAAKAPAPAQPAAPSSSAGPIPTTPPPVPPLPTQPISSKPAASITPIVATPSAPGDAVMGPRSEKRVKMSRMRLRIAQRLKDAQNTCAMLTTFNEIDMSNIMELRKTYKDAFIKRHGIKLGFMSAFIKAASVSLQAQPEVNAVIDDQEIVYRDYVDISVAVATPKGLVVPVLRNVEGMNYSEIEQGLNELGEKAKLGNLAVEDMDGGTFTISNGGVFGSMFGTPIINPPQSAILGMHGIFDRPVAVNGKVEIRPMMYVALTYDHRLIDGREGVTFLRKIKAAVEDPRVLFLDL